jgi:phage gp36-like protein
MAYCTQGHIESEFKDITFGAATPITDSDVARFIAEADAEIEGVLSQKYVVPVTGTTALIILRQISIMLVKARIQEILQVKTGQSDSEQEATTNPAKKARDTLDLIQKGKMGLVDATIATTGDGVRSYTSENSTTFEPTFKRDQEQW